MFGMQGLHARVGHKKKKNGQWLILWMTINADNSDHDASLVPCSNSLQFSLFFVAIISK